MKKVVALLIAAAMAFSVIACASDAPGDAAPPVEEAQPSVNNGAGTITVDVSEGANSIGFFLDDVDPQSRRTYDVVWSFMRPMPLMQNIGDALVELEDILNVNIIHYNADGDIDALIQNIEIFAAQGVDGFIIVIDPTASERIKEVLDNTGIPYIAMLNSVRDENGRAIVPGVGLDGYQAGRIKTQWLYDNYRTYWGEIDTARLGLLNFNFSPNVDFNDRYLGALSMFQELFPGNTNIFSADGVAGRLDEQTGFDLASAILATNPDVEHWFIPACLEHYAQGAARAVESLGMQDRVLITTTGSDILSAAWDSGYDGAAWVSCIGIHALQYAAPALCALVALMNGTATPDTLWSGLRAPGDLYTFFYVELEIVTRDTYQDFFNRIRAEAGLG
ncbi:MAG: substrate-binding domain-containing protein [Oscillospiraceae bacterium]|nr:substrate-binding domain-containing protein [Oscillospiraceae bacterium]